VTLRLPRISSIFFVQRTTTQRTYQPVPAASGSRCDPVLVDQPTEQVLAAHVRRRHSSRSLDGAVRRFEPEGPVRPVPLEASAWMTPGTFVRQVTVGRLSGLALGDFARRVVEASMLRLDQCRADEFE
jgi:hypothetical protein